MNDELAGLPGTVREAIRRADASFDHTGLFDEPAWQIIRAELLRLARENAGLRRSKDTLALIAGDHGRALGNALDRAERAEAELAALKRRIAEAPVVRALGTRDAVLNVWNHSHASVRALEGELVALLPVGGE